jgi:hypothetical protein
MSNFAGKEFELSRPQMIIGRTDENDIVINHRSISRNHAKLVREPETGRYTISDLQSSNGVRVNGQDYGKVELRRGDVVDLGHVRLRFVEAGEDFVFSRDAVITDVPDVGGKKGLLVAIVLGVVLLGGIGVFFAMKGGGGGDDTKKGSNDVVTPAGSGTNGSIEGSGSDVVAVNSGGSDAVEIDPIVEDAPSATGSNTATTNTNTNPTNTTNTAAADDIKLECTKMSVAREWTNLLACSERLAAADPTKAKELRAKATAETKAESAKRNMEDALDGRSYAKAKTELDRIPRDSVYRTDAESKYRDAVGKIEDDYADKASNATTEKACKAIKAEAANKGFGDKAAKVRCPVDTTVAVKNPNTNPNNGNTTGSGSATTAVAKPDCDADQLRQKGDDHLQTGMDAAALASFEASMRCRPDPTLYRRAFLAACRSKNTPKAKQYYTKLPAKDAGSLAQMCIRNGIQVP